MLKCCRKRSEALERTCERDLESDEYANAGMRLKVKAEPLQSQKTSIQRWRRIVIIQANCGKRTQTNNANPHRDKLSIHTNIQNNHYNDNSTETYQIYVYDVDYVKYRRLSIMIEPSGLRFSAGPIEGLPILPSFQALKLQQQK